MSEIYDDVNVVDTDVDEVEVIDPADVTVETEEGGGLGGVIAAGIGVGVGVVGTLVVTKFIPWAKDKKLQHDKAKLAKLEAKISEAETEADVEVDELTPLTEEETAEIKKLEQEAAKKKNKNSK